MTQSPLLTLPKTYARGHSTRRGPGEGSDWKGEQVLPLIPLSPTGYFACVTVEDAGSLAPALAEVRSALARLEEHVSALTARLDATLRDLHRLEETLRERPIIRCATLSDLGTGGFSLTSAVSVVIEEYESEVIARWPEIEAVGSGSTEAEALWRLKEDVVELIEELTSAKQDELGPEPQSTLQVLKRMVSPNGDAQL